MSKHYSQMSVTECRDIERKNDDLSMLNEAMEALETVKDTCRAFHLETAKYLGPLQMQIEDEIARVEER